QLDPGSPLACEERGIWFLAGTATAGGCPGGGPPLFTAVPLYERWITGITREAYFAETPPDPKEAEEPDDPTFWGTPQPPADPGVRGSPKPTEDVNPTENPKPSENP
ncbi:PRS53 protease, partial [Asarcornis scutulata]|nr:PRS53 protease [Asarcornis scutulata]